MRVGYGIINDETAVPGPSRRRLPGSKTWCPHVSSRRVIQDRSPHSIGAYSNADRVAGTSASGRSDLLFGRRPRVDHKCHAVVIELESPRSGVDTIARSDAYLAIDFDVEIHSASLRATLPDREYE